jgi:hypothetical protein
VDSWIGQSSVGRRTSFTLQDQESVDGEGAALSSVETGGAKSCPFFNDNASGGEAGERSEDAGGELHFRWLAVERGCFEVDVDVVWRYLCRCG